MIADNRIIEDYIKDTYGKSSSLIGYGGDHVSPVAIRGSDPVKYPFMRIKTGSGLSEYAISVGRIVPENNYEIVLEAYRHLPEKNLVVIGNWGSSRYGKKLKNKFHRFRNIFLLDPVYDQQELDMLRSNASLYIHGHSSGGTNPSLVEAMYLGLPVIAHNNPYNLCTTENQAYYFNDKKDLIEILANISHEDLKTCGTRLQVIAHEKMRWGEIALGYADLIQ